MNWQTVRSCGKRREVASSLFSRIHWRKLISPFGLFWTVRIQRVGGKKQHLIWMALKRNAKVCSLTSVHCPWAFPADSMTCENQTHSLSLISPSGAQDGIFLCIPCEACRAAGSGGSAAMLYKTLHRLFLAWSFREAKLIGVAMLSVSLLSPTKDV